MIINGTHLNCELADIVTELQTELHQNHIKLLEKTKDIGKDIQVQCPYHGNGQERRPSAGIRKTDGKFHCFACGETHELPEVVSFCLGYPDDVLGMNGWRWILRNFATVEIAERKDIPLDYSRTERTRIDENAISEEELDKYRYYHSYWRKRGITSEEIIELFDLGYDIKTDCITFPVRDKTGRCLFVARRAVSYKMFNYPKGAEKPLYGLYELSQQKPDAKELFVTESMIDCILLWQAGFYAVALNGVGSQRQYAELEALPARKLILATDGDSAGQKARRELKKHVRGKLYTEIDFPAGIKDVGECMQEQIENILDWEVF